MFKLLQLAREASKLFEHLAVVDASEHVTPGQPRYSLCIARSVCKRCLGRSRFVNIVGALDSSEQTELKTLTFSQLVTRRENRQMIQNKEPVFRKLVQQMVLSPSHQSLADSLMKDCPSFFGSQDNKRLQVGTSGIV